MFKVGDLVWDDRQGVGLVVSVPESLFSSYMLEVLWSHTNMRGFVVAALVRKANA